VEILRPQEAVKVKVEDPYRFVLLADGSEISARALLVATGVSVRRLEVPGVERLTGAGVYYGAALTEASFYKGQEVIVVGGANSAGQAAIFFSRFASKTTIIVRSSTLSAGMSQYLVDQINSMPNIEVLVRTEVIEAVGESRLEAVKIANIDAEGVVTLPASAMFIFIGAVPHTELVAGIVARDRSGFILTGSDLYENGKRPKGWKASRDPLLLETSIPGIFAAGDVRHYSVKRIASAVGEGAVSVALIHQYLKTV
jgi:thioredoxin reductase (NADPH)